jgi:hypothetical protein
MTNIGKIQLARPYVQTTLLFFMVVPAVMIFTATALQLVGGFIPPSFEDVFLRMKQAYFISAFVGIPFSVLHTYLLRRAHVGSKGLTMWRSAWYAALLGSLTTLSLFRFFPLGYDAIFYVVPGVIVYGAAVARLAGRSFGGPSEGLPPVLQKPSVGRYLLNAVLFVLIAAVVITAGLWTALKTGVIEGSWLASPFFLFLLTAVLSLLHSYFLGQISEASPQIMQQRSVGLAGGLSLLAGIVYVLLGNAEFILFVAAALLYGWLVGYLESKSFGR